jgi:hypothetical protein
MQKRDALAEKLWDAVNMYNEKEINLDGFCVSLSLN